METALILAGGLSRRMGRPKAFERLAGTPMVRRVVDALAPLAAEVLISVADDQMAEALRDTMPAARFVLDRRPGSGPIEGIARGVEVARGDRILVAPCDAPLLRTDLYRLLLEILGDREAAVPKLEVLDPVRAVYGKRAVLRELRASEGRIASPSALVDRLDAVFLDAERIRSIDPHLDSFLDVNSAEDLAEALRRLVRPA